MYYPSSRGLVGLDATGPKVMWRRPRRVAAPLGSRCSRACSQPGPGRRVWPSGLEGSSYDVTRGYRPSSDPGSSRGARRRRTDRRRIEPAERRRVVDLRRVVVAWWDGKRLCRGIAPSALETTRKPTTAVRPRRGICPRGRDSRLGKQTLEAIHNNTLNDTLTYPSERTRTARVLAGGRTGIGVVTQLRPAAAIAQVGRERALRRGLPRRKPRPTQRRRQVRSWVTMKHRPPCPSAS